jgi:hypothetical protein
MTVQEYQVGLNWDTSASATVIDTNLLVKNIGNINKCTESSTDDSKEIGVNAEK